MKNPGAYRNGNRDRGYGKDQDMTMVHTHPTAGRSSARLTSTVWLHRLAGYVSEFAAARRRARMMRALEALPPETLKDIGWPTTDNNSARIVRK